MNAIPHPREPEKDPPDELPGTWIGIPQSVPSSWCFSCDVCCRFPEKDSFLAPYFTGPEISLAIREGIPAHLFSDPAGSKITLIPFQEGYICPCFSPEENRCTIYPFRPLDCRIYPFALMRETSQAPSDSPPVLGADTLCPFIRDGIDRQDLRTESESLALLLETPIFRGLFYDHPDLINRWQEDVLVLGTLKDTETE